MAHKHSGRCLYQNGKRVVCIESLITKHLGHTDHTKGQSIPIAYSEMRSAFKRSGQRLPSWVKGKGIWRSGREK